MISFEEMPVSAQKAYTFTNKVRKAVMFIGLGIFLLNLIISFINGYKSAFISSLFVSGIIPGFIHGEFAYKKMFRNLFIIGLFIDVLLATIFAYAGFIFLIADTILYIMKKPLVYPFENKCFLETRKAQEEIAAATYNVFLRAASSDDAMTKLQKLKEMMEQGVITEEEFNRKKAELLEEI